MLDETFAPNKASKENQSSEQDNIFSYKYLCRDWNKSIVHYVLFFNSPSGFDREKYRDLRMSSKNYVITNSELYWKDPNDVLLLCLTEDEIPNIINEHHGCAYGCHYSCKVTLHKILKLGFYWPTLFSDVY